MCMHNRQQEVMFVNNYREVYIAKYTRRKQVVLTACHSVMLVFPNTTLLVRYISYCYESIVHQL